MQAEGTVEFIITIPVGMDIAKAGLTFVRK